jgi:hypothetical protein
MNIIKHFEESQRNHETYIRKYFRQRCEDIMKTYDLELMINSLTKYGTCKVFTIYSNSLTDDLKNSIVENNDDEQISPRERCEIMKSEILKRFNGNSVEVKYKRHHKHLLRTEHSSAYDIVISIKK